MVNARIKKQLDAAEEARMGNKLPRAGDALGSRIAKPKAPPAAAASAAPAMGPVTFAPAISPQPAVNPPMAVPTVKETRLKKAFAARNKVK